MSSFARTSIVSTAWTEVVADTATKCYIQSSEPGVIWQWASSLPAATADGHDLLPGHPILLENPATSTEALYCRHKNMAASSVKATTI